MFDCAAVGTYVCGVAVAEATVVSGYINYETCIYIRSYQHFVIIEGNLCYIFAGNK